MATEGSRSSNSSVDSYIGSLISLTSKSEIRYEGILYNINTEESSIGLTNVRSFGTEGRKKDGKQVIASDKVYEYILFRGSDIKDLQVKSTQPVQPAQPINSDPAIIQSHYPRPTPTTSSTLPPIASDSLSTPSTYNPHLGQPGSTFQSGLPLYQPGGPVGPWGPSPPPPNPNLSLNPNPNASGIAMPMYWPGYYAGPQNALQQPMPQPPMQQYPSFNASLPTGQPNISASSAALTSNSLLGPAQPEANPVTSSDVNVGIPPIKPNALSGARFPYITSVGGVGGGATVVPAEPPTPSLVTPGQLLQSVPGGLVSTQAPQPPPAVQNDVEIQLGEPIPASSSPPSVPVAAVAQPPILPLPTQTQIAQKSNGSTYQNRPNYSYRGRERGRESGGSHTVMKFTEEFDFIAMNEKFNKDEVWGSLGKKEKGENATDDDDDFEEENVPNFPKPDVKPVYSKDDFFDTLSSNTTDRQSNYGRTRFSEQMKLDTETFGEFSRYRGGGRGGRGSYRGGRSRGGGYYGRGGGYGYVGRGRGGGRNSYTTNDY